MTAAPKVTIIEVIEDPLLFKPWFKRHRHWWRWRIILKVLFGLQLDDAERVAFAVLSGRAAPPTDPVREMWLVCGRRAGKSFIVSLIAVYLAVFKCWTHCLSPGERGTIMVVACDRKQSRVIMRYIRALLENVALLKPLIERQGAEEIDLKNRITIEIHTASFRSVRGYTLVAALCDEIAFWRNDDDSTDPDTEILAALRPGLATTGGLLLCASSPYARRGAMYQAYTKHFGKDSKTLVIKAPTRLMNPTVPQEVIDAAIEADPAAAGAEYMAEFRRDIETFISREALDACTVLGRHELPPLSANYYTAFVDPSGGSQDAMTLAVAHRERDMAILDAVREVKPPFSPEGVVKEFAALLKSYRLSSVTGDRYAGEWPREQFRNNGIAYNLSEKPRSDIYRDLLPEINSGKVELLDNKRLIGQFLGLERRTARGGRDSIDHAPGSHDDIANAAAGALLGCVKPDIIEHWTRLAG